jgi:hypothetical protein
MKTLGYYFFIGILISAFVATSCRKEDDEPLMTAKVNGSSWTALVRNVTLSQSQNIFVISGFPTLSQTASQSIVITVRGSAAGTYSLSAFGMKCQVRACWFTKPVTMLHQELQHIIIHIETVVRQS